MLFHGKSIEEMLEDDFRVPEAHKHERRFKKPVYTYVLKFRFSGSLVDYIKSVLSGQCRVEMLVRTIAVSSESIFMYDGNKNRKGFKSFEGYCV